MNFKCLLKGGFYIARKRLSVFTPLPLGEGSILVPPHSVGEVRWGANMMFASILFPQTEISPLEDVEETFNVF